MGFFRIFLNLLNDLKKLITKIKKLTGQIFLSLQNQPTFNSEERLVNLERGSECFAGLSILLVNDFCTDPYEPCPLFSSSGGGLHPASQASASGRSASHARVQGREKIYCVAKNIHRFVKRGHCTL